MTTMTTTNEEAKKCENKKREKKKLKVLRFVNRTMWHGLCIWYLVMCTGVDKYLFILHKNETKWAFDEVEFYKDDKLVREILFCSGLQ